MKLPPHPLDMGENKYRGETRVSAREALVVAGVLAVAAAARVSGLGDKALWYDEAISLWFAQRDLATLWWDTANFDFHTPFYYALLHYWVQLFGDGEIALRSLSAALSFFSVPLVYALGRLLLGPAPAAFGALVFAITMMQVWFAQEARMYALMTFSAALALYGAARVMADQRRRRTGLGREWVGWVCYAAGAAGALWSHNAAVLLPLAVNLAVLGRWLGDGAGGARFLIRWFAAQAAVLALWAPWVPRILDQARDVDQSFWIKAPDAVTLAGAADLLYPTAPSALVWLGPLLLAVVVAGAAVALRRERAVFAFLALAAFLPFLAEAAISTWKPVFLVRTLVWVQIPYCLLLAATWRLVPGRLGQVLLVSLVVGANLLWLAVYFTQYNKEPWAAAARDVAREAEAGDTLLFVDPVAHLAFEYYFRRYHAPLPRQTVMGAFPVARRDVLKKVDDAALATLATRLAGAKRVWVIWRDAEFYDPTGSLTRELSRLGRRESELAYSTKLIVARYALTP